jgi:hypothetical protein
LRLTVQNRRSVLTLVAGGGHKIAGASAPPTDDPIYAAIAKHKASIVWYAAVDVRSNFPDLHMTVEQRRQRDVLDAAVRDACEPLRSSGVDLLNTRPTTLAGIVVAIQYMRFQMSDDGTYMPHHLEYDHGGDAQETMAWIDAFLDTLAGAVAALALQEGDA